ncbi:aspartyle protease precursor [Aphelenchoides avenae]|nr:aspartyle protease precursor [Aphelenchus avenae]
MRFLTASAFLLLSLTPVTEAAGGSGGATTPQPVDLRSYRDQAYAVPVDFGTPAQTLYLAIDVFGTDVTVASTNCTECCHKTPYDASKSTAKNHKCLASTVNNDGTQLTSCTDDLSVGKQLPLTGASFDEVVSTKPGSAFATSPADGTVGLQTPSWPKTADRIFGLYLTKTCKDQADKAGTINLLNVDPNNCGSPKENDLAPLSGLLKSVQVGGNVWSPPKSRRVTFTTTSNDVAVPQDDFTKLNTNWKATQDKDSGEWRVPCTFNPDAVSGAVMFTFDGGPTLEFVIQHFIDQVGDTCVLRIRPKTKDEPNPDYWAIGLPVYRKYCTLFDFKANAITFAPAKNYAVATCKYGAVQAPTSCTATTTPTPSDHSTKSAPGTYPASTLALLVAPVLALLR